MKTLLIFIVTSTMLCGSMFAQQVLRPHFTDESIKIVIPRGGSIFPEIHEGIIVVSEYPRIYYVNKKGEYIFGSNFPFTRGHDRHTAYFSGGAMMGWRTNPNTFAAMPFIVYPDGRYRDFPTGTRNNVGMPNDVFAASPFVDGIALVQRGNLMNARQSFIDKDGKDVFPALASNQRGTMGDMTVYPVRENRRVFYNAELRKYGYADARGTIVIQPRFERAENFSEGLAAVLIEEGGNRRWGFIDPTGNVVIPATYTLKPGRFSEGLAAVRIGTSEHDYEMAYIDKTGRRVIENKPWNLNEFHNGYAWVGTGYEKLFVWNKVFKVVRDVTAVFYHEGNGFGTCMFSMLTGDVLNRVWGIDFPNGMQMLNQGGVAAGEIFAPDGRLLFTARDSRDNRVLLHNITEDGLIFTQVRMENESRLGSDEVFLSVFINQKGEIVYYFVEGVEGFEGRTPVLVR